MRIRFAHALAAAAAVGAFGMSRPAAASLQIVLSDGIAAHTQTLTDGGTGVISGIYQIGVFNVQITANAPPAIGTISPGDNLDQSQNSIDVQSTSGTGTLTITESSTNLTFTPPTYPGPSVAYLESDIATSKFKKGNVSATPSFTFQSWVDQANLVTPTATAFTTGVQGPLTSVGDNDTGLVSVNKTIAGPFSLISKLTFTSNAAGDSLSTTGTTTAFSTPEPATLGSAVIAAFGGIVYGLRRNRRPARSA